MQYWIFTHFSNYLELPDNDPRGGEIFIIKITHNGGLYLKRGYLLVFDVRIRNLQITK
jgi:hypothetical protein